MDLRIRSLVDSIKADNRLFLKDLYNKMRPEFMAWFSRHYFCSTEDVEDAYQRSFNIFYFNVKDDKVSQLDTKANTYLFSIGKNVMLKVLSKEPKNKISTENVHETRLGVIDIDNNIDDVYQKEVVARLFSQLDEGCRKVLMLCFYNNFSMDAIASEMNFRNEAVAKKKKHLCLKKLKELVDRHKIARDSLV